LATNLRDVNLPRVPFCAVAVVLLQTVEGGKMRRGKSAC
jgi:hypothetical protein